MEARDRSKQEELQQKHLIELGTYAAAIQQEALKQQEASLKSLQDSKKVIDGRIDHFNLLLEQHVSPWESSALESQMGARGDMNAAGNALYWRAV